MWLCLNKGFFIISENEDAIKLTIGSVKKEHLSTYFPKETIREHSHYCSINIDKEDFADWLFYYTMNDVCYTNFKNSVKDYSLHDFYCLVWTFGFDLLSDRFNLDNPQKIKNSYI